MGLRPVVHPMTSHRAGLRGRCLYHSPAIPLVGEGRRPAGGPEPRIHSAGSRY